MIISRSVLLAMKNVSDKYFRENQNHNLRAIYETSWKNTVQPNRPQLAINKAQKIWDMHAGQLRQQWQCTLIIFNTQFFSPAAVVTRISVLHYKHIVCLVCSRQYIALPLGLSPLRSCIKRLNYSKLYIQKGKVLPCTGTEALYRSYGP